MRKIYFTKSKKYKEFKKSKKLYVSYKILLFSSICSKWGSEDNIIFREK